MNDPSEPPEASEASEQVRLIGGYRIVRELGRGGMGVVYEAIQEHPRRTVALKVVTSAQSASKEVLRRFQREAEVLGRLQHPGIAQIFEAGQFDLQGASQSFFAMELVRGRPLNEYAEDEGLDFRERLALMAEIADAVHHAHQRGVIHRDLKPGNILVDGDGQPKVLDFGIARVTDADLRTVTLQTDVGQVIGTIPYMSPEQASGNPELLDQRSDVYSLGVVAYELVAGCLPYELDLNYVIEAVRRVKEEEARPLSSVDIRLRGDIETIVGKALEKDPERRYPSAAALADDIRRFLADQPITARPPSRLYQLRKFARRNRAIVTGLVAVFVALIIGLVGTSLGYLEAERRRTEATHAKEQALLSARRAKQTSSFLTRILAGISPTEAQGQDTTLLRDILADTAARIDTELADSPLAEAEIRQALALAYSAIAEPASAAPHVRRALELFEAEPDAEDGPRLRARAQLGSILARLGQFEEAEELLRDSVERGRRELPPDSMETLSMEKALAIFLHDTGQLQESMAMISDVVARMRRDPETTTAAYVDACIPLSTLLLELDRDDEAEVLLDELVTRTETELGEAHPLTIQALFNRAALDKKRGSNEVVDRYLDVLERSRRVHGEDHAITHSALRSHAQVLRDYGRWDEAEVILHQILRSCEARLGYENPQTLAAKQGLAQVWIRQGKHTEAEQALLEILPGLEQELGPRHVNTLDARLTLGSLYRRTGRFEEARETLIETIGNIDRSEGNRGRLLHTARGELATTLHRLGRTEEALEVQWALLAEALEAEGTLSSKTLVARTALSLSLSKLGRYEEAKEQILLSLAGHRELWGEDHPETATVLFNAGSILSKESPWVTLPHFAQAARILHRHSGPDHPHSTTMLASLQEALWEAGPTEISPEEGAQENTVARNVTEVAHVLIQHERSARARPLLEWLLKHYSSLDSFDPRLIWTQTLLGAAHLFGGELDEAGALLESADGYLDTPEREAELDGWLERLETALDSR